MIYDSQHALVLGGTPIDGYDSMFTEGGYRFSVLAEGYEPGSAEAVESVVRSLAADGSSARIDGSDNAKTTFRLQVEGEDIHALNRGEAAFRRLLPDGYGAPTDLLWRPPQDHAPASVRTILTGTFDQDFSDLDELNLERIYAVTLTHRPFVRSEFPSVANALPIGEGVQTLINDCSSTAGWSALGTGGTPIIPTTSGGAVHFVLPSSTNTLHGWTLTLAGTYDLALTPYLMIEVKFPPMSYANDGLLAVGGRWLEPVQKAVTTDGYMRYMFDTSSVVGGPAWSPGPIVVHFGQIAAGGTTRTLSVRHIDALPVANPGLPRQNSRLLKIGGTERTPGTMHVSSRDGSPLGLTIVHTSPDEGTGYDPDLSRWITSILPTADLDPLAPMGGWVTSQSPDTVVAEVPSASLPTATYQIALYLKSTVNLRTAFQWTAWTAPIPGLPNATAGDYGTTWVDLVANQPTLVGIGTTTLPASIANAGRTRIEIIQGVGAVVKVGGMWLFRTGRDCGLTAVRTDEPHMWVDSDEAGNSGTVLVGSVGDRSDAYAPSASVGEVIAADSHTFRAGNVITYVASLAPNAAVQVEHYRRWPYNAADDGTGEPT